MGLRVGMFGRHSFAQRVIEGAFGGGRDSEIANRRQWLLLRTDGRSEQAYGSRENDAPADVRWLRRSDHGFRPALSKPSMPVMAFSSG